MGVTVPGTYRALIFYAGGTQSQAFALHQRLMVAATNQRNITIILKGMAGFDLEKRLLIIIELTRDGWKGVPPCLWPLVKIFFSKIPVFW